VIVAAGQLAHAWLAIIAMMAAQGTLLALVALAIARTGRLAPSWQAAIWLVVIVKLALPWGPALPWSISDLVAMLTSHGADAAAVVVPPALAPVPAAPSIEAALGWLALGTCWLGGASYVLVHALRTERRAVRAARRAPDAPAFVTQLAAELAARYHVRRPRVALGDRTVGPHVVGLFRPTIAIPPALLGDRALLRAALLHELAHLRRRDAFARVVQIWVSAIMFWWPVARRIGRRLELAREAACDAWALEAADLPRPAYARMLVQMANLRFAGMALAAPHALDARIEAVLGPPARTRLSRVQWLALGAWTAIALGGARSAAAHGETCRYTPELAEQLMRAHPEADLDGDGVLSRDEACELQAELRRQADPLSSPLDESLRSEPLCCNCDRAGAYSSPDTASCPSREGVDR
jgi:beta-lactamase regulating signal transducer with metallopeptidase domain